MHNPLSWGYLTAPSGGTPSWGPLSIAYVLLLSAGLVGMVALRRDAVGWLRPHHLLHDTVRRACLVEMPILAAGLVFFLLRALRASAYDLDTRVWLYGSFLAAVAVAGYFARSFLLRRRALTARTVAASGGAEAAAARGFAWLGVAIFVIFMAVTGVLYLLHGIDIHPDRVAILLFVVALLLGQWKSFLRDWVPLVLLLFGYEFLRGLAYDYIGAHHQTIHMAELIAADRAMFGGRIPALWLQQKFYVAGTVHWYDVMAVVIYALLFAVPLLFAFLLWLGRKERFWEFSLAFLVMTYAGFVIYLLYPAAPPWMANQSAVIHGLQEPFNQVWQQLAPKAVNQLNQYTIWTTVSGDPVAAMPSIHSAYPWITLLFAVKFFRWKGLVLLPYNVAVWFTVLYLGQHWFIDIIFGVLLASLAFGGMQLAWPWVRRLASVSPHLPSPAWADGLLSRVPFATIRRRVGR